MAIILSRAPQAQLPSRPFGFRFQCSRLPHGPNSLPLSLSPDLCSLVSFRVHTTKPHWSLHRSMVQRQCVLRAGMINYACLNRGNMLESGFIRAAVLVLEDRVVVASILWRENWQIAAPSYERVNGNPSMVNSQLFYHRFPLEIGTSPTPG